MNVPEQIGKFEILRRTGKDAMGKVFSDRATSLGRDTAIRVILADASFGEEAQAPFEREARSTALLCHPNIVTVVAFNAERGLYSLALQYLAGETLETLIQEKRLTRHEALEVLTQAREELAYTHKHGVIHQDVKPANSIVVRWGKRILAQFTDFGASLVNQSSLTQQGVWRGTANDMAPEYLDTGKTSASSDLFAIEAVPYEVLTIYLINLFTVPILAFQGSGMDYPFFNVLPNLRLIFSF